MFYHIKADSLIRSSVVMISYRLTIRRDIAMACEAGPDELISHTHSNTHHTHIHRALNVYLAPDPPSSVDSVALNSSAAIIYFTVNSANSDIPSGFTLIENSSLPFTPTTSGGKFVLR